MVRSEAVSPEALPTKSLGAPTVIGAPDAGGHLVRASSTSGPGLASSGRRVGDGPARAGTARPSHSRSGVERRVAGHRAQTSTVAVPTIPGSAFAFAISREMGVVVVRAQGCLDASSGAVLRAVLVDLIEGQGNLRVVVDVHDMAVADPSSLDVLVAAAASAARRGGQLSFAHPGPALIAALDTAALAPPAPAGSHRLASLAPPSPGPSKQWARRAAMAQHPAGTDTTPDQTRSTTTATTGAVR